MGLVRTAALDPLERLHGVSWQRAWAQARSALLLTAADPHALTRTRREAVPDDLSTRPATKR